MIFISLLILIVAIALPSINKNITPILYSRISAIVFIYAGALSLNALYIQSIGSGIGIYSGLFHVTAVSQLLDTFIFIIGSLILISWPSVTYKQILTAAAENEKLGLETINKDARIIPHYSEEGIHMPTLEAKQPVAAQYSLIVLFSSFGASLLVSSADLISMYLSIELQSFNALYIQLIGSDIGVYSSILHHFIFGTLPIIMVNHNYLISPIFFSTEDKKSLARKAWFGLKEGKDLQLLPPQNIKFYKDIFFNIFRILGGISSFLLVSSISNRIANKYYFYIFYLKKLEWCTIIQGAKLTIHAVPLCMNLISYGYILRSYLKLVNNRKFHKNLSPEALKILQKARNRNLVILAIVGAPLTLAILRKISGTISKTLSVDIPI